MTPNRVCSECWRVAVRDGRCEEHPRQPHRSPSSRVTGSSKWRAIRRRILERDGGLCQIRGPECEVAATQVDHILEVSKGGTDKYTNLRAACARCNQARNRV